MRADVETARRTAPVAPTAAEAIRRCRDGGSLALVVYLVHGYPTTETSERAFDLLRHRGVPVVECAMPVAIADGPPEPGDAIGRALRVAATNGLRDADVLDYYATQRPNILIDVADPSRDGDDLVRAGALRAVDAVISDDDVMLRRLTDGADGAGGPAGSAPRAIPLLAAHALTAEVARGVAPDALVYLAVGDRTGGTMLPAHEIARAVALLRQHAPDATVLCGFGVRTPDDVARLAAVEGVDGVAVGTEALRRLDHGLDALDAWLLEMQAAARVPA
ncbi:beta/alpha barrel domain-containing protein [Angustibacter aerolatus]|uniref:tryptophan synthase n=1 Tax=Angustibacter aerolatus TaxID=1162965 RepID=A0ABQ6JLX2_9ACTN|nr:tryptophan synthase subunit alpha [Angustibacter aerolatus]GMA88546.1 hypothetical protein GCM10025868_37960 [Angustibacter aerolatus]